ncbi:uncharacterized protein LOC144885097 [Branchiostoma floridae x Branchiostoma japonicum]
MGKTRAEIQRAYRERKKAKDEEQYKAKEAARAKKHYKPAASLSHEARERRNAQAREKMRRHRARKQAAKVTIKMDFKKKNKASGGPRKKIKELQRKLEKTLKAQKKLQKRLERAKSKGAQGQGTSNECMTPRSKTNSEIRAAGLTPRRVPDRLRKKILFSNVVTSGIKESYRKRTSDGKRMIRGIVVGKIVKKYRMISTLAHEIGVARNARTDGQKKTRLPLVRAGIRKAVHDFMEREDNSRIMPGKNDYKKIGKNKVQVRVLTNYLTSLREKFVSENPDIKISLSVFARLRPPNIKLASFLSRNTCLCTKHQNFALKLKTLKEKGLVNSTNPDNFLRSFPEKENVKALLEPFEDLPLSVKIKYEEWQRVEENGKKRMKIVTSEIGINDFADMFIKESVVFREHTIRANEQYAQLKALKETLPPKHVIIQMDFAENYKVKTTDEIQSAYWNCEMVTLHPVVLYYRAQGDSELQHESICVVSDELGHNSSTVYAILKRLLPKIKQNHDVQYIHYWTDSPSSQYRNKTIFSVVSDHKELFGVPATWNYFEAGHGKGPCDGVGGTAKRMADDAVKRDSAKIQDAHDFYEWAINLNSVIKYEFVTSRECGESKTDLGEKYGTTKAVKGTMTFHAVVGMSPGVVKTRPTSCYCAKCFNAKGFRPKTTCTWKTHNMTKPNK